MRIYDFRGQRNVCGANIRRIRIARGMSQKELAAKCQLEEVILESGSISRIELGTRVVADYEMYVIAKILGVRMEDLLEIPKSEYDD